MDRSPWMTEGLLHQDERQDSQQSVGYLLLQRGDVDGELLQRCGHRRGEPCDYKRHIQNHSTISINHI